MFQVSTSTGSLSHYYNLAIIVPRAYILGADEYYAMAGGDISLVCIIEDVRVSKYYFKTRMKKDDGLKNGFVSLPPQK